MNDKPPVAPPERNPKTQAAHRKDVWWQISFPLIFGCLILALLTGGVIWSATGSGEQVSRWADISLIWLILPALFFALLGLGVVAGLVYLVSKLIEILPGIARKVQDGTITLQAITVKANNALVAPVLKLKGWSAAVRRVWHAVAGTFKPDQRQ